ncbi:MAG: ethanolamine utilization protein EutH, partial [Oscillospiraceae bacterium]|nr:ethanolamine utilization protein EutH [Oscillospiraceae bacterium]
MEIFIFIMAIFAFIGLVDYTFNLGLGLAKEFEKGLNTMGGLALSVVGFYAIGVSFVQNNAEQIAAITKNIPFDPSLIIGSLLAPDMGAMGIATNIAATPQLAVFSGALVAGGLGATIGYQLPVFLAAVRKDEIPDLMQGFICGIIPLPVGLFIGGMMLGVPMNALIVNMIPVTILCVVLILAVAFAPNATTKVLTLFGNF